MNLSILALQMQNWLAILERLTFKTHFWPWCIILHAMILDFVPHEITRLQNFSKLTCTAHSQSKPWNIFLSLAENNTSHKSADMKEIMILILSTSLEAYTFILYMYLNLIFCVLLYLYVKSVLFLLFFHVA